MYYRLTLSFRKYFSIVPFISVFLLLVQLIHGVNSKQKEAVRLQATHGYFDISDVVFAWTIF